MKLSNALYLVLATSMANKALGVDTACITEGSEFELDGCDYETFEEGLQEYLTDNDCAHDAKTELRRIFNTNNMGAVKRSVKEICKNGWGQVDTTSFSDVDERFNPSFMNQYVSGDTFLNTETGSFEDTEEGNNIDAFRDDGAASTVMKGFPALSKCDYNSIMCCFGRDRQPNDNNGNCADPIEENCVDADPADNSNLCYVEHDLSTYSDPFAFPNDSEGDIHCHGLAWAEDENDFTAQLRFNNFFYVSLYDHMYTRGYVETSVNSDSIDMCACIEDMPPVSRSDCTEIDASATFTITYTAGSFEATAGNDLSVEFNACQGTNPSNGDDEDNDLASYVYRLNEEGKVDDTVMNKVFETLVGYAEPNDNDNEAACEAAYEAKFGTYPDVEDKKCPFGDASRLFRTEDSNPLSIEECQELCYETEGCDYFSVGLDAAPQYSGLCIGCSDPGELEDSDGFNTYEMTDKQVFPTDAPTTSSDEFNVVGKNLKCPHGSKDRLFRTADGSPLTREECYQKCYDTPGCNYFTLGVNPSSDRWKGICMGCVEGSTLQSHDGFTSYEMVVFKEDNDASSEYSLSALNMKCPQGNGRLFRTPDRSPLTKDECYQKCVDTEGCEFFTYAEGGNLPAKWEGMCMGCTAEARLSRHNGFNTYEVLAR